MAPAERPPRRSRSRDRGPARPGHRRRPRVVLRHDRRRPRPRRAHRRAADGDGPRPRLLPGDLPHQPRMGDVVPVAGRPRGRPARHQRRAPTSSTLTALPWEPGAAWALGDVARPRTASRAARVPRAGRSRGSAAKLAELGVRGVIGPGARVLPAASRTPRPTAAGSATPTSPATSTSSAARATRAASCSRRCASCATPSCRSPRRTTSSAAASSRSTSTTPTLARRRRPRVPDEVRRPGDRPARRACSRRSWPSRSTTRAAAGFHLHVSLVDDDGQQRLRRPGRRPHGLSRAGPVRDRRRPRARPGARRHRSTRRSTPTSGSGRTPSRRGSSTGAWTTAARWSASRPSAAAAPAHGGPPRRRHREPLPRDGRHVAAAVYLGIRDELAPPAPLEGYGYDPESAPMLPQSLPEALDALEADTALQEVLGEYFVTSFLHLQAQRGRALRAGTSPTGSSASTPTTCERRRSSIPTAGRRRPDDHDDRRDDRHRRPTPTCSDLDLLRRRPAVGGVRRAARRDEPVHWNPEPAPNNGFWSVTRHADIVDVEPRRGRRSPPSSRR